MGWFVCSTVCPSSPAAKPSSLSHFQPVHSASWATSWLIHQAGEPRVISKSTFLKKYLLTLYPSPALIGQEEMSGDAGQWTIQTDIAAGDGLQVPVENPSDSLRVYL